MKNSNVLIVGMGHIGGAIKQIIDEYNSSLVDRKEYHVGQVYAIDERVYHVTLFDKKYSKPTSLEEAVRSCNPDIVHICFGITEMEPHIDTRNIVVTCGHISDIIDGMKGLEKNRLMIIESTVPVGTTDDIKSVINPKLWVVHSPILGSDPHMVEDIRKNPKFIGGDMKGCGWAWVYYDMLGLKPQILNDAKTAEFIKLANNTWQDVNIGFANEMARLAGEQEIDYRQCMEMFDKFLYRLWLKPGLVGGHCVPNNPHLLNADIKTPIVQNARTVNEKTISTFCNRVTTESITLGCAERKVVTIVGLSYKPGVADMTNSPGVELYKQLILNDIPIMVYDPMVRKEICDKNYLGWTFELGNIYFTDPPLKGIVAHIHGELPELTDDAIVIDPINMYREQS